MRWIGDCERKGTVAGRQVRFLLGAPNNVPQSMSAKQIHKDLYKFIFRIYKVKLNIHMKQLIARLDIKIIQDWDSVRQVCRFDKDKMSQTTQVELVHESSDHAIAYMGGLSQNWTIHSGNSLKKLLPWYNDFLKSIKGLQYDGCGFQRHSKPIKSHADRLECHSDSAHSHVPSLDRQCKINYVVYAEDPNTTTTVIDRDDPENIQTYNSVANGAWLLNINHPHSVNCNCYRDVISFKFCEKFETVLEHFQKLGPITFQ
jgi:hypothetical protein